MMDSNKFNKIMKGYIVRALSDLGHSSEEIKKVFQSLSWATSEMTLEDALEEYEKYLYTTRE
jgi:Holliday junction resolvasome RuvABC DNA-binding subunit